MPPKKAKTTNHKMVAPLKAGTVFQDVMKKQWYVGPQIGQGGFGAIYSCSKYDGNKATSSNDHVLKVEPYDNGPLFIEISFYQRVAKQEMVDSWVKTKRMAHLGVPKLIGSGISDVAGQKVRFMIMQKFGGDLQKELEKHKTFPYKTVLQIALQLVDALEYLHNHEYVHADIKGANILTDLKTRKYVYLVDFGLAHRYAPGGVHQAYKADPKKAHDGTIEYTSIDAHCGTSPSRRSDLEILGYVLLHWATGSLPWMDSLTSPNTVKAAKENFMKTLPKSTLFSSCTELKNFFVYVKGLQYSSEPNYEQVRKIFHDGLKRLKASAVCDLVFSSAAVPSSSATSSSATRPVESNGRSRVKPKTSEQITNSTADSLDEEVNNNSSESHKSSPIPESSSGGKRNAKRRLNDQQSQTSPWMYEQFKSDRRRRRLENNSCR